MVIDSVILGGDASQANELFKKRPVVQVYKVQMENNETAVAKVPVTGYSFDREVRDALLCPSHKGAWEGWNMGCSRVMTPLSLPALCLHLFRPSYCRALAVCAESYRARRMCSSHEALSMCCCNVKGKLQAKCCGRSQTGAEHCNWC